MSAPAKAKAIRLALEAARDAGVGPSARSLLASLVAVSWPYEGGGDGWAVSGTSRRELAAIAGVGLRQVRRLIVELEDAGLVIVHRGRGRDESTYVLTTQRRRAESPPDCVGSSVTPQRGHRRPLRGDTGDPSEGTPATPPSLYQDCRTITTPSGAAGGGVGVDQSRGLSGRAAVVYGMIARRPPWYTRSDWLSPSVARQLASLEHVTPTVVEAALEAARDRRDALRPGGAPGFVRRRIEQPETSEVEAIRRRHAELAAADRRHEAERARREAERLEVEAAAAEDARQAAEALRAIGEAEADRLVADYLERHASRFERHHLLHRTPAERREWFAKSGRLGLVLEGVTTS